jgi:hypothetical protein
MYAFLALITAFLAPLAQHGALIVVRRYSGNEWDLANAALFFGGFTALVLYGVLITVFDIYLWRMNLGSWMFTLIGLSAPPDLNGEYGGTLELDSAKDGGSAFRTDFFMRISQTWQQISLLVQREAEAGGMVLVHSDMASIRVGMLAGVTTLRFVYTFEESLPRRDGVGSVAQQFSGAATFEFRRDGEAWKVSGHFFDDIGRSGQISLRQRLAGSGDTTLPQAPTPAASSKQPQA